MSIIKNIYIEVISIQEVNLKLKEGYEFITIINKTRQEPAVDYISDIFMGNSLNFTLNKYVTSYETHYLIKLTKNGELLYGN